MTDRSGFGRCYPGSRPVPQRPALLPGAMPNDEQERNKILFPCLIDDLYSVSSLRHLKTGNLFCIGITISHVKEMKGPDLDCDRVFCIEFTRSGYALNVRIKTCLEALLSPYEK